MRGAAVDARCWAAHRLRCGRSGSDAARAWPRTATIEAVLGARVRPPPVRPGRRGRELGEAAQLAAATGSTVGVERWLGRVARVSEGRQDLVAGPRRRG